MGGVSIAVLSLLVLVGVATMVPHRRPEADRKNLERATKQYAYVWAWPEGMAPFTCRRRDLKRCNDADYTSKFRRIRPGAYWAQRVLGYSELPPGFNFMTVDFIWLEIPLSQIGKGHDFDFNVLRQMPASVIINRFQNLAQELNQKDRFAVSAAREKDVDLVFPDTLTTPVENDSILDRAIGQDELWLAKPAFGGAGKGIELFRGPEEAKSWAHLKNYVLQRYILNPATIDGHRFTMRLYGVVTSIQPLKFHLNSREGIIKFTTEIYNPLNVTLDSMVIRQEQYRNKDSHESRTIVGSCASGNCNGSRWDLRGFWSHYGSKISRGKVWNQISKCARAAIRVALSSGQVVHRENSFQVLGIDFDFDEDLLAYFIEANVTPALGFQTEWEVYQKERVFFSLASLMKMPTQHGLDYDTTAWEQII